MYPLAVLLWLVFVQAIRISAAPTSTTADISITQSIPIKTAAYTQNTLAAAITDAHSPNGSTTPTRTPLTILSATRNRTRTYSRTWTWHGSPISPTRPPPPARPVPSDWPHNDQGHHRPHRIHQTPIVIFFEVVCGIAGAVLIFSLLRCIISYRKTPERDRIADVINRHRLQREMDEMQYAGRVPQRRGYPEDDPVPPYIPRPPSYAGPSNPRGPEYAEVPSSSPPGSPPTTAGLLERTSSDSSEHGQVLESTTPVGLNPANHRPP